MKENMWKVKLRWFRHVIRKCMDAIVWRCEKMAMVGFRQGKGRSKIYWRKVIRYIMEQLQLIKDVNPE